MFAIGIGVLAGLVSIGAAFVPNLFNSIENPNFNTNLRLTWFAGVSLQGILAAALLAVSIPKLLKVSSTAWGLWACGLTAVLAAVVPAPCILWGRYADGLVGIYAIAVTLAGALFAWTRQKRDSQ